jgi:DNA repair ATPase RecN
VATPPINDLPTAPSIPLTPEVRAAYQDLYNKIQAELDNTMDLAAIQALNPRLAEIDQILTKDDLYKLSANTVALNVLQKQISDTNRSLDKLHAQITSIASHFQKAADILAAIEKVLTLIPGV